MYLLLCVLRCSSWNLFIFKLHAKNVTGIKKIIKFCLKSSAHCLRTTTECNYFGICSIEEQISARQGKFTSRYCVWENDVCRAIGYFEVDVYYDCLVAIFCFIVTIFVFIICYRMYFVW